MCCPIGNAVGFKMGDSPVPSLWYISLHCDNCGALLPLGKDFSQNWTNGNSRHQSNPFSFKQVPLTCKVCPVLQSMVQGLDSNSILSSSVPSREAVSLGYLRHTQNHSTPGRIQGENKFGGWDLGVLLLLCFCCSPRKGKDYVFINNLEHISSVITHVYPCLPHNNNAESRFGIYRGICLSVPQMLTFFSRYQRHHFTKKEKSSCNSALEKYIKNFAALTT